MTYSVDVVPSQPCTNDSPDVPLVLLSADGQPRFVSTAARRLLTLQRPGRWSEAWSCLGETLLQCLEPLGDAPVGTTRCFELTLSLDNQQRPCACSAWKIAPQGEASLLLLLSDAALPTTVAEQDLQAAARWRTLLRLLPGITHSLRNPLNTMGINLLLLQEALEADGSQEASSTSTGPRHYARVLQEESERLGTLLDSFLGQLLATTRRSPTADLPTLLRELATFIAPLARRQSITFNLRVPDTPVPVFDPARHIEQALLDVLVNALEALPSQGHLDLWLESEDARAMIVVEDDGPGIPRELVPAVFERHVTTRTDASGIGLYVARRLIEACHGEIRLSSRSGETTRVEIILPVAKTSGFSPASPAGF